LDAPGLHVEPLSDPSCLQHPLGTPCLGGDDWAVGFQIQALHKAPVLRHWEIMGAPWIHNPVATEGKAAQYMNV